MLEDAKEEIYSQSEEAKKGLFRHKYEEWSELNEYF